MTTAQVNHNIDAEAMIADPITTCLVTFDIVLSFQTRSLLRAAHNPSIVFIPLYLSIHNEKGGHKPPCLSV